MKIYILFTGLSLLVSQLLADDKLDVKVPSQDHRFEKRTGGQGIAFGNGWVFLGDIRAGWVQYNYQNPPPSDATINKGHTDSHGFYVMPKLSLLTPEWKGFSAKVTGAGATGLGLNDPAYESRNFVLTAPYDDYMILQEAYLLYENKGNKVLIGCEELTTPMIDADDWYMLANSFELAYYQNKMFDGMTFDLGYFSKMAGVWDSGANGTEFYSMAETSYVDAFDKQRAGDAGVAFGAFTYKDDNHNVQIWNYYGFDLYNTLFLQYDYTSKIEGFSYDIGVQIIDFQEVGLLATQSARTNIDYSLYSLRFNGEFSSGVDFSTGASKYSDGEGQGATLGAWGGYPYFANGMIFHFFEAGSLQNAASYKAQIGYNLEHIGLNDTWLGYRYTYFDLDSTYSKNMLGASQDAMRLNGFRVSYGKNHGAYFTGTYEHVDLDAEPNTFSLRLIGGYKF